MTRCCSFDVFDTCLTRNVVSPTELFRVVGGQIGGRIGAEHPAEFAEQFTAWRIEAERRTRERRTREDIDFAEIWSELRTMAGGAIGDVDGAQLELEAEVASLGPIRTMLQEVDRARAAGHRIIFISDMYLPAGFIRQALEAHGFWREGDGLYVSSECGVTKSTGRLFKLVLEKEGINPAELRHVGDNPSSDIRPARELGIEAVLAPPPELKFCEHLLMRQRPPGADSWCETAGRLRFRRCTSVAVEGSAAAREFVDDFLGPVYCLFCHWILERARAEGVARIYFAARDSRLAWLACRQISAADGVPVDCRYLVVSRRSLFLPATDDASPKELKWVRRYWERQTIPELIADLGLQADFALAEWKKAHPSWALDQPLGTEEDWADFWRFVGSPPVRESIAAAIAAHRRAALAYLEGCGILDDAPSGLVDIGWLGTGQGALRRLCSGRRKGPPLRGYYLALKQPRLGPKEGGPATAMFFESGSYGAMPDCLVWIPRHGLVENLLGWHDGPSVSSYQEDGTPKLDATSMETKSPMVQEIEAALLEYVAIFYPIWARFAADPAARGSYLALLMEKTLKMPPASVLAAGTHVRFYPDLNHRQSEPVVRPMNWAEVAWSFVPPKWSRRVRRNPKPPPVWPEAALAATPTLRRLMCKASQFAARYHPGSLQ